MRRKISEALAEWKNSNDRKPLILNGARQVGKTYILEQKNKKLRPEKRLSSSMKFKRVKGL